MSHEAISNNQGTCQSDATPPVESVAQMKQYLTSQGVRFDDCVEKADLVRRCHETREKQATAAGATAAPPKACDCAQATSHATSAHTHATSSSIPSTRKEGGSLIRTIAVGPLQCNMTIIADATTKEALLIDPGGDAEKILALIAEMGVTVRQILVTHAHFDHFLAAEEIRTATKAPVALHKDDLMLWQALPLQCMMLGVPAPKKPISAPDTYITDGQALAVANGRAIHTPGHSPGSTCYYFPDDALLCSGDTLFKGSVGRTDLMGGDAAALVRSIQTRLYTLPGETHVIPGHGPTTDIAFEAKYNGVVKATQAAAL